MVKVWNVDPLVYNQVIGLADKWVVICNYTAHGLIGLISVTQIIKNAQYWVEKFGMLEHPEGGYFAETYRSTESIPHETLPERFKGKRVFSTGIYFLLENHHIRIRR